MRRLRLVYFAVVTVIVIVLGVFAGVVWSRGEAAHVTLHTVAQPPAALNPATPGQPQQLLWRTSDHLAMGTPRYGGTVITYSTHTVRGVDARTGRTTWSYTRTDRTVCAAVQLAGKTMAIYEVHGNCDEVTALRSGSGRRAWTRTLDKDAIQLNGHPAYQWIDGVTYGTLMLTTPSVIYAIDPGTGLDRWTYQRYGCRITRAVLGSSGALIAQNCVDPDCSNLDHCGSGAQLMLRDPSQGNDDDSKRDRDRTKWNLMGNAGVPVSAGTLVTAVQGNVLTQYRADKGTAITTMPITASAAALASSRAGDTAEAQLLWLGGVTYALSAGRNTPLWSTPTVGPPSVVSTTRSTVAALATARITAPTTSGAETVDGPTGTPSQRFALGSPGAGGVVVPLGSGFLVGSAAGVAAYR